MDNQYANGTCRCGSVIKCKIDNSDKNNISTKITCKFIEGNGRCGKRYLRMPIRETVVEKYVVNLQWHIEQSEDTNSLL